MIDAVRRFFDQAQQQFHSLVDDFFFRDPDGCDHRFIGKTESLRFAVAAADQVKILSRLKIFQHERFDQIICQSVRGAHDDPPHQISAIDPDMLMAFHRTPVDVYGDGFDLFRFRAVSEEAFLPQQAYRFAVRGRFRKYHGPGKQGGRNQFQRFIHSGGQVAEHLAEGFSDLIIVTENHKGDPAFPQQRDGIAVQIGIGHQQTVETAQHLQRRQTVHQFKIRNDLNLKIP